MYHGSVQVIRVVVYEGTSVSDEIYVLISSHLKRVLVTAARIITKIMWSNDDIVAIVHNLKSMGRVGYFIGGKFSTSLSVCYVPWPPLLLQYY